MPFAYVASPYSHDDVAVRAQRFDRVCSFMKYLAVEEKITAYSPIMHWHPLAVRDAMPTDAKFWSRVNFDMMNASSGVILCALPGWGESKGVAMELNYARAHGMMIVVYEPLDGGWRLVGK